MMDLTISRLVGQPILPIVKQIESYLNTLKGTYDLTKRTRLKERINTLRLRLDFVRATRPKNTTSVFTIGDRVQANHPRFFNEGTGTVKGVVIEIRSETCLGIKQDLTERTFLFHPENVIHDIPFEIYSFSYWP